MRNDTPLRRDHNAPQDRPDTHQFPGVLRVMRDGLSCSNHKVTRPMNTVTSRTPWHKLASRTLLSLAAGSLLMTASLTAGAEQLKTPVMQQGSDRGTASMPQHGQLQDQVRQRYGQPQSVKGPVGNPPITQWIYDDFIVYFEYNHVIHSVRKPESN